MMEGQGEVLLQDLTPELAPPSTAGSTKLPPLPHPTKEAPAALLTVQEEKCDLSGEVEEEDDEDPAAVTVEGESRSGDVDGGERDEETEMAVLFEVALIRRFDRSSIDVRNECWFLMDAGWLNQWARYVQGQSHERPGPITNARLYEEGGTEGTVAMETLKPGLKAGDHYRAVTPTTWFIYVALYGKDRAPEVCRYRVDLYSPAVPLAPLKDVSLRSSVTARIEVGRMRAKLRDLFPEGGGGGGGHGDDDYLLDPEARGWCCCCWVRRERLECALFWMFTWCVRLWPWHQDHSDSPEQRAQGEREMVGGQADDDKQLLLEEGRRGAATGAGGSSRRWDGRGVAAFFSSSS